MARLPRHARRRAPAPFSPPVQKRRDPRLYQKRNGFWNVRFRHGGQTKDVAMGLRSPYVGPEGAPPASKAGEYVFEGGRWIPRHVHERFVADFLTPYLRDRLNPWDEVATVLLRDAVNEFLAVYDGGGHTHRVYKGILERLKGAVGDPHVRLDRVGPDDVAVLVDASHLSAASRRSYRRHLRAFFNWALDRGYVRGDNPVDILPEPRTEAKAKFVYCGPDEFERVLTEVDEDLVQKRKWLGEGAERHLWVKPVFELAVMTGL